MGEPLLILVPAATVLLVAVFGWLDAPRAGAKRLAKLAASTGLALDDDTRRLVTGRLRRRQRAMMLGMAAGDVLGILPVIMADGFASVVTWWVAIYLVSTGVGAFAVHVVDSGQAAAEPGRRAAVLRRRKLHDFMYPAETIAPFAALVMPALAIALAVSSTGSTYAQWLAVGAGFAVLATAATVVAQRFVLHMAPPADSPTRLQWEDALRGVALRDLGVTAFGISFALGGVAALSADRKSVV